MASRLMCVQILGIDGDGASRNEFKLRRHEGGGGRVFPACCRGCLSFVSAVKLCKAALSVFEIYL